MQGWWERQSHLRQALVVGVVALIVPVLIAEGLWLWFVKTPPLNIKDELGLQFSFFQVVSAFATTLLAGFLGWLAVQEFREQHQSSEIHVDIQLFPKVSGNEAVIDPAQERYMSRCW